MPPQSVYDQLGGEVAINAAVERFYDRVLADPALAPFFTGIPMSRLKSHQAAFLSQALGGPTKYSGASMRAAHAKLAIEQLHFDLVATHLVETLRELGVSESIIQEVAAAVVPLSGQVVNTPVPA